MRESGYYWIRLDNRVDDPQTENGWEVAYYLHGEGWMSIWDGGAYRDDEVLEIDEHRLIHK